MQKFKVFKVVAGDLWEVGERPQEIFRAFNSPGRLVSFPEEGKQMLTLST